MEGETPNPSSHLFKRGGNPSSHLFKRTDTPRYTPPIA
ncbi:hypothetical protein LTSEURB_2370 [Salmonella enterica subsp. enterica serovar Urbana str. R8-2977]|uniref:Uncharacterized protein n=1 Tax=Salmonella enterica subsp. enterica serovar Urbana str. R8-2977 TaxID=913084 RepID=G5RVB3_SALET|nr:hypothetical protein LTSEURB_2370 [Salmonella enterica subsp. enterica serovar Urbana str. R8-2977]